MKPTRATRLAFVLLAFLPSMGGATPIQDARVFKVDAGDRERSPGVSEFHLPGNVFQVINTGYLTAVELFIFAMGLEPDQRTPLKVALWTAHENQPAVNPRTPDGGLVELLDTSETMPIEANPWWEDTPQEFSFVFATPVPVTSGQWLGFRTIAIEPAGAARLWGSDVQPAYPAFTIWVDPDYQPEPLPGDIDADGAVGLADFGILKAHFGLTGARGDGDLTGDGRIDISDFGILKDNFGKSSPAVPEPAGWVLAAIAAMLGLSDEQRSLDEVYCNVPFGGLARLLENQNLCDPWR